MKKYILSSFLVISCLFTGCSVEFTYNDPFSKEELPKSEEKAKKAVIEYFKDKENIDVIIDRVSISAELGPSEMFLDGHVIKNKNQKIIATVQFDGTKIVKVSGELST
ncbi:hypothetical protein FC697_20480 [Bacillus wiedmannii]|uniref:hypothetical protein n=1 Tax=Bacillus wiedmannii TaxID=1890302 RepID=UPI0010BD5CDE|nr:hypothetical protein [Bacillus wiedmannii]TKH19293.1 hypothetical protein FC697_20480 [Bacillus wiedmannii]